MNRLPRVLLAVVVLIAAFAARSSPIAAQPRVPPVLSASVIGRTVTLTWTTAESSIERFVLEVGSRPGVSDIAVLTYSAGTRTVTASDVIPRTYYVRLFAFVAGVASPASNVVEVVVGPRTCLSVPEPPRALVGNVSGQQISLSWTEPFDPGGACPLTGYVLEGGRSSGTSELGVLYLPVTLSYAAVLPPGTYYIRARAYNSAGLSRTSNELRIEVGATPGELQLVSSHWQLWPPPGSNYGVLILLVRNGGGQVLTNLDLRVDLTRTLVYSPPEVPRTEEVPFGQFQSARLAGHTYRRAADGRLFRNALGPGEVGCAEVVFFVDPLAFPPVNPSDLHVHLTATGVSYEGLTSMTSLFTVFGLQSARDALGNWRFSGRVSSQSTGREEVGVNVVPMSASAPLACLEARPGELYPGETVEWEIGGGALPTPTNVLAWPVP